jgi:hypothetical protein
MKNIPYVSRKYVINIQKKVQKQILKTGNQLNQIYLLIFLVNFRAPGSGSAF